MVLVLSRREDAWRFRESCPEVLRVGSNPSHGWSEKATAGNERILLWCARVMESLFRLVGVAARKKKAPALCRGPAHPGARRQRAPLCRELAPRDGSWKCPLRLGFAAVELAHHVGANRPRGDLCGRGFFAF